MGWAVEGQRRSARVEAERGMSEGCVGVAACRCRAVDARAWAGTRAGASKGAGMRWRDMGGQRDMVLGPGGGPNA